MERQQIKKWKLLRVKNGEMYRFEVPGSVLETLQEAEVIPDPYVDDNEKYVRSIMEEDFEIFSEFDCDEKIFSSENKELVFEGIDTLADVYLNGEKILTAENMHRTYRCDVSGILREKSNTLKLHFYSPLKFIRKAYEECVCDGTEDAMRGFVHLRKAHYMFGWDWGARIPDAGLFRPVTIEGYDRARLGNVRIHQEHSDGEVVLTLNIDEKVSDAEIKPDYEVIVSDPDGSTVFSGKYLPGDGIALKNPRLWWPNGYGEQNLYTVEFTQKVCGEVTDEVIKRIGLRTLTVTRKKDEWGESFSHCVNGVDVFAFGADYIPEDNYLGRITGERTRILLSDCRAVNFNSIRVWGGGFFPGDEFYDICDEMGLMVWQDLMFACGIYDLNESFEDNIHMEIRDNLQRIADHPCLALICGNNEMEMFVKEGLWVKTHKQKADYIKMYEYLFPKWVKEYAPDTVYWPSSPSSGGSFDDPNSFDRGDVHFWQVWHDGKPFTEYRKHHFRYLSEFGFQALPSEKTLEKVVTDKDDFNLFSYNMEKHQSNRSANSKIMQYMQATFKYPSDFDTLIYASQLLSGEAIRFGVEHFRRNRGRCMGTLYWQLNDCWPVISWASVDYYGRWKALHYFAKRFFAPVLLSCEEKSTVSEGIDVNDEITEFTPSIRLNVSNETMEDMELAVEWELRDSFGNVIEDDRGGVKICGSQKVSAKALGSVWLEKVDFKDIDIRSNYVSFRARTDERIVSSGSVMFVPPKYFRFEDPALTAEPVSENEIRVEARAFARNVEIRNEDDDLVLEDNFFDMDPGVRILKVYRGRISALKVRCVRDIH